MKDLNLFFDRGLTLPSMMNRFSNLESLIFEKFNVGRTLSGTNSKLKKIEAEFSVFFFPNQINFKFNESGIIFSNLNASFFFGHKKTKVDAN